MLPFIDELKSLNLPPKQYAIFGSGPMAVRNIREAHDLDIVVKKDLWDSLAKIYPLNEKGNGLKAGHVEIFSYWNPVEMDIDEMVRTAEVREGLPFVKLAYVIRWKSHMLREKDKADLELIAAYLKAGGE